MLFYLNSMLGQSFHVIVYVDLDDYFLTVAWYFIVGMCHLVNQSPVDGQIIPSLH